LGGVRGRTLRAANALHATLDAKPRVRFVALPLAAFYPQPVDGVRDFGRVSIRVRKPVQLIVHVFAPDGSVAATIRGESDPGIWTAAWNGVRADGSVAAAGKYRYRVIAIDRAGNRRVLPGLGALTVARDTEPPRIDLAHTRLLGGVSRRKVRVRWRAVESLSPQVRATLVVRSSGIVKAVRVPAAGLSGTKVVRIKLAAGTWTALVRVTDGSGNVATRAAGTLQVQ
jgi:hypothetical protein